MLSLNGLLGDEDRTVAVPFDLYDEHVLLDNGVSPFDRLKSDPASSCSRPRRSSRVVP